MTKMIEQIGSDLKLPSNSHCITIGNFDGVHRGHRFLVEDLVRLAKELDKKSLVILFQPHPRVVLRGEKVELLNTLEEKHNNLIDLGVDRVFVLPFTREVASKTAKEFIEEVLLKQLGMAALVLGYDHSFGKDRDASDELLNALADRHGFVFERQVAIKSNDEIISSTKIRKLVKVGLMEEALQALGRPFSISGTVVEGQKRGRTIGFPTANLSVDSENKIIPPAGVYVVKGRVKGQLEADGMLNIGVRPSFDDGEEQSIETFFFDTDMDLYGKKLHLYIYKKLRNELKFDSIEDLKNQLVKDEDDCIKYLKSLSLQAT